jgi:hypothetical protein
LLQKYEVISKTTNPQPDISLQYINLMGFKHRDITKQKIFARTEEIYATRGFEESCKCIRLQNQPKTLSWFARNEDETPHKKARIGLASAPAAIRAFHCRDQRFAEISFGRLTKIATFAT